MAPRENSQLLSPNHYARRAVCLRLPLKNRKFAFVPQNLKICPAVQYTFYVRRCETVQILIDENLTDLNADVDAFPPRYFIHSYPKHRIRVFIQLTKASIGLTNSGTAAFARAHRHPSSDGFAIDSFPSIH